MEILEVWRVCCWFGVSTRLEARCLGGLRAYHAQVVKMITSFMEKFSKGCHKNRLFGKLVAVPEKVVKMMACSREVVKMIPSVKK